MPATPELTIKPSRLTAAQAVASTVRFDFLVRFTSLFRDHKISPPIASDLAFMRRILQSEAETPLHRAYCGCTLGFLLERQGDFQAAVSRYRRAVATVKSATEAYRRAIVISDSIERPTGELLDDFLGLRFNLEMIEDPFSMSHPSSMLHENSRTAKISSAILDIGPVTDHHTPQPQGFCV
ncbi:hypothetical protein BDK51DRAFT_29862 [Blyttiomyces helicus]|uniref:Uncharacterized protein n=1 Tax=Blyttiomyces helicus TaxID=388810 RepID=A0A4P9WFG1_9FUNG|nr:hypothetical protein BDK51DRAFT_29862 [Blyttiomyces helicus]|eukprot:RKO89760.1 hypothetical protein BDK51DRAFT_29862 [Blyttiomyces helicus]